MSPEKMWEPSVTSPRLSLRHAEEISFRLSNRFLGQFIVVTNQPEIKVFFENKHPRQNTMWRAILLINEFNWPNAIIVFVFSNLRFQLSLSFRVWWRLELFENALVQKISWKEIKKVD